ncbi:MAG: dTMP kinase [Candidatus Omnitrophica bacterium]|nr:dTMP kinase [Candidatus Omnitrophota bacterium]
MKGKFITFEGPEGSGKSTHSRQLADYLKRKGYRVVYLREPGGTKIGEKIRKILLDAKNDFLSSLAEMLLYMAARAQLVSEIIKPALKKGKVVICDRFLDSTLVYQGYGLKINMNLIKGIGRFVTQGITPDLTILLDLPVKKGLRHCGLKKDRIERRSYAYHMRVHHGYLKLAGLEPKRIKVVKIQKDKIATQKKIRELVEDVI